MGIHHYLDLLAHHDSAPCCVNNNVDHTANNYLRLYCFQVGGSATRYHVDQTKQFYYVFIIFIQSLTLTEPLH